MEIFVNGEPRQVADSLHVSELVEMLDLANRRIAVEVNLEIVPRSTYTKHLLQAGDKPTPQIGTEPGDGDDAR